MTLSSGEQIDRDKLERILRKCGIVADAYNLQDRLVRTKAARIANLEEQVRLLEADRSDSEEVRAKLSVAVDEYRLAVADLKASIAARDEKILLLEKRNAKLEKNQSTLLKKITYIVIGVGIGTIIVGVRR